MGLITRQELAPSLRKELDDVYNYISGSINEAIGAHMADKNNPHGVTKSQVGLGNVSDVLQASKSEFDSHVSNMLNPHGVTTAQIGAVPTSRQVKTGFGLKGGRSLGADVTIDVDYTYLNNVYLPKTGGDITGRVNFKSSVVLDGGYFLGAIRTNGNGKWLNMGTGATDVYFTNSKTGKYLQLKDNGDLAYSDDRVILTSNIRYGTGAPSGGRDGDIYIQY